MTFQAKNCLVRKKKIETLRDGKETALENIRHMLRVIQQVETDKMVRTCLMEVVSLSFCEVILCNVKYRIV